FSSAGASHQQTQTNHPYPFQINTHPHKKFSFQIYPTRQTSNQQTGNQHPANRQTGTRPSHTPHSAPTCYSHPSPSAELDTAFFPSEFPAPLPPSPCGSGQTTAHLQASA